MKITFTKRAGRTQLICVRGDGTLEKSNLGPQIPFHDLAHFVVEQELGFKRGFLGYVQQGYSIEELSKKEVLQSLDPEVWQSEILTRALGSLATGACTLEQFNELVNMELKQFNWPTVDNLSESRIKHMLDSFRELMSTYNELEEGGSMSLQF